MTSVQFAFDKLQPKLPQYNSPFINYNPNDLSTIDLSATTTHMTSVQFTFKPQYNLANNNLTHTSSIHIKTVLIYSNIQQYNCPRTSNNNK